MNLRPGDYIDEDGVHRNEAGREVVPLPERATHVYTGPGIDDLQHTRRVLTGIPIAIMRESILSDRLMIRQVNTDNTLGHAFYVHNTDLTQLTPLTYTVTTRDPHNIAHITANDGTIVVVLDLIHYIANRSEWERLTDTELQAAGWQRTSPWTDNADGTKATVTPITTRPEANA